MARSPDDGSKCTSEAESTSHLVYISCHSHTTTYLSRTAKYTQRITHAQFTCGTPFGSWAHNRFQPLFGCIINRYLNRQTVSLILSFHSCLSFHSQNCTVTQIKSNPRWGPTFNAAKSTAACTPLVVLMGSQEASTGADVGPSRAYGAGITALCLKTRLMRPKLSGMTPVRISSFRHIHRLRTLDRRQIDIENRNGESNVVVTSAETYQFGCMGQATMMGSRHSHHLFTIPLYVRVATSRYQISIFNHHRPQQVNPSHCNR